MTPTSSIGGGHIKANISKGIVAVSRADEEVSEDDILRAITNASAISLDSNREVIHVIPREFNIDGQAGIQDPRGMTGVRLEVDTLIIEGLTPYIKNLRKCLSAAGVEIEELVLDVLAICHAVISRRQKELGVLVLDFGAGTVGMAVYEERKLLHVHILHGNNKTVAQTRGGLAADARDAQAGHTSVAKGASC